MESFRHLLPFKSYFHFRFSLIVSTSGSMADVSGFRCRQMSGRVGSVISESGIVENVGVAVGIASLTLSVQLLFPLPVSTSGSVSNNSGFRCWTMSGCVGSAMSRSGTVENVGVAVGIASTALSVHKLFPFPIFTSCFHFRFRGRRFGFPMLADVGPCRRCHF